MQRGKKRPLEGTTAVDLKNGSPVRTITFDPSVNAARGAELLFDVISAAYERTSVIVTTNLPFEQ
jgi:hypothetical protein